MRQVLFAASEAVPLIKTGGLADVIGALPKYINKETYDVRVILPRYLCRNKDYDKAQKLICSTEVMLGWRRQHADVYETVIEGVTFYLIENDYYFTGTQPYAPIQQDAEKFAFFCEAVLAVLPMTGFCPEIIHCHDWQTGLIPVLLHARYGRTKFYEHTRTICTIHNLKFQGCWYIDAIRDITDLPDEYFTWEHLEFYGKANYLKGGIVYADLVTTVSKTYAREICGHEMGEGMDGVLCARSKDLYGITNGLDTTVYDPKNDPLVDAVYTDGLTAYKKAAKRALQTQLGLRRRQDLFLIGIVSRLTDQKGMHLITQIADELISEGDVQLAVLGVGEKKYEEAFERLAADYPTQVSVSLSFSEELAHRIYAGCDAFLMPSLFEPCGISQLAAMRYGTVPLVRKTGGLADTVIPYAKGSGTGFTFSEPSAKACLSMILAAKELFAHKKSRWRALCGRAAAQDNSWRHAAANYEQLYEMLLSAK